MEHGYTFNSLSFIADGGPVSIAVVVLLLLMSVASWYLMVAKALQSRRLMRMSDRYSERFWQAASLESAIRQEAPASPLSRLASQAIEAAEHHQRHAPNRLGEICSQDEFITRVMRRVIGQENARLEAGLTVLASVGSVSPFVGLFGTVWGIYHALAAISVTGQATLDKVAGPVGEALIMTAIGLAVAIPSVLAYNALVRSNRIFIGNIESFAHDLHTLLTTGATLQGGVASHATVARPQASLKEVTA